MLVKIILDVNKGIPYSTSAIFQVKGLFSKSIGFYYPFMTFISCTALELHKLTDM